MANCNFSNNVEHTIVRNCKFSYGVIKRIRVTGIIFLLYKKVADRLIRLIDSLIFDDTFF